MSPAARHHPHPRDSSTSGSMAASATSADSSVRHIFERLTEIPGYRWDVDFVPFHSSYDNYHFFGTQLAAKHPDKLTYNHHFDPRNGEAGLERLHADAERFGLQGVKLYTAEWHGESRGWKLTDPWAYRYLERCQELGIRNIHIHKGPTIYPLNRDAFDVADVDDVASAFPELNFIVEHVGLPRLEDFCWIATQEPNVYGGLAVAMAFMHHRPRYFAQIIGELLFWLDENRITFSSDYAIWTPKWLVEQFVDFQIPEDMQDEYGVLTTDVKRKILGLNAARLYDIEVPAEMRAAEPEVPAGREPVASELNREVLSS